MTLDELANELCAVSDEKAVRDLAKYIEEWKGDDRNAEVLENMVERFFGNVWISKEAEHSKAYRLWSSFRDDAIHGIGGMTMNERLYAFGLFERFDSCKSEAERLEVYGKVHAKP
ncbi:hypothetical protein [Methylomonas rhizoryzae]|uniref:hypothetical protein n=1 Tax=Methylomonas rhizoryzae TaxID=2608981 RepID=UPI00123298F7|nr:hypothetical protein [Methylomonas rhizoryzae]